MSDGRIHTSQIVFFGETVNVSCDTVCVKAFGLEGRQRSPNSLDPDDWEWLADDELAEAPERTGILEGDQDKPRDLLEAHNKWCVRQCERAVITRMGESVVLLDFSHRVPNIGI